MFRIDSAHYWLKVGVRGGKYNDERDDEIKAQVNYAGRNRGYAKWGQI